MTTEAQKKDKLARYGKSEHGNFEVVDTIAVPHPYCIGAKHVVFAADHHGAVINEHVIEQAERNGIFCETCKGKLKFADHKQALLVRCKGDLQAHDDHGNLKPHPELKDYLDKSLPLCEADGYVGFAFLKAE